MRKADVAVVKVSICNMAREWHELEFEEREIYFQWIWTLMDEGRLFFEDMEEVEAYAKEMYRCDVDHTRRDPNLLRPGDDDPFQDLDVDFQDY